MKSSFKLTDRELETYIGEDIPYFDLTTYLQEADDKRARMEIFTREDVIVSCSEESARIAELLGCKVDHLIPSCMEAKKGDVLVAFSGDYTAVHQAWRSSQVLLEYSCKIATYANRMKKEIEEVNSRCELLATRKSFPFAKRFCIKSLMCGGAMVHRLGLGETVLFFNAHRIIYDNDTAFYASLEAVKVKAPEKKIVVESESVEDAKALMHAGADVLQIDKVDIALLREIVLYRDHYFPLVKILAAGGITLENAKEYAQTGIDAIVTSALHTRGMADMGTRMKVI